jgi:hypothetical protein
MRLAAITLALAAGALAAATPAISDPEAFVRGVYRQITVHARDSSFAPPDDIYTPQLAALFAADRKKSGGEVGCIDFDFWTNSQDPTGIRGIRVSSLPQRDPARRTVIAAFTIERPQEIHFEFRRIDGRWLLDDASSVKAERWTLSKLLRCW